MAVLRCTTTGCWMILVTVMFIYLSSFRNVSGLNCFQCISPKAPSEWSTEDGGSLKFFPDCSGKKQKTIACDKEQICAKTEITIDRQKYVIERCAGKAGKEDSCEIEELSTNGKKLNGKICFCNTDQCNGGGRNGGSSFKSHINKNYMLFLGSISFIITVLY